MAKVLPPELKRYMEKRLAVKLNGKPARKVTGTLVGYDQFMNLVLDNTTEHVSTTEENKIGMVVIRGNSVVQMECLDRVYS